MKKEHFLQSEGFKTVAASVLSILIGLAVGSIVILIVGLTSPNLSLSSAWDGISIVFGGQFSTGRDASATRTWGFNPTNIGNMLFRAAPLIMTGLSVGMAYKTGLFNIGAPGQYLIGTLVSLSIALGLPSETMSTTLIWLLAFLGGTLAGAIWGAIPGLFKALLNINEVLACIMTNWIAANLVTWLFDISNFKNVTESTKTGYIYKTTYNGVATAKMGLDKLFPNSQVNGGILIAVIFAIGVYVMMSKTTFGYQLKACGSNRHAARYAGIADKRNIVISMAIAGGLSAAGASLYYLSGNTEFFWSTYQSLPAIGFNGIPVAMLASCNPIGIIFTALFMSMLDISGLQLTNLTAYNEYITDVIIAVIVYLSAFSLVIKLWISRRKKEGKSILFITHKLNEIMAVADRCTVLRKGKYMGTVDIKNTTKEELSRMMVGRDVQLQVDKKPAHPGEVVLDVEGVTIHNDQRKKDSVKDVTFQVHAGEIVCLAGIEGNGQTEFVYGLTGLEKLSGGKITLDGKDITHASIRQRSKDGMSHIPEDRHKHGLVLDYSLENNMVLQRYWQPEFQKGGFIQSDKVREYSDKLIAQYDVRSGQGSSTIVRSMSGGNQQKAIIAREIDKDPKLLVAVQPTRGLDVGAIEYIHRQIVAQRDKGKAVLLVSLELDEVMNLSDRILVMYEGEIVGEFDPKTTTVQELGLYMAGARKQGKESK